MFASVAAILVVQQGLNPSTAAEPSAENELSVQELAKDVSSNFFGDGFLAKANKLEDLMISLMDLPELNTNILVPTPANAQIHISLPNANEKNCQVAISMSNTIEATDIQVGLESGSNNLVVKYKKKAEHNKKDEKKGEIHFAGQVSVTQSVLLPENCLAIADFGGYLVDEEKHRALVVFPEVGQLKEHVGEGRLPEAIVEMLENGDEEQLSSLSPEQLCLAAGFTTEQCGKLGNKRPVILSVAFFNGEDLVPVGLYEGSLQQLD